jgi:alkylglycerol monooxygenase
MYGCYRPADVAAKYPVYKIENVYDFKKYASAESKPLLVWIWIQLIMLLLLVSYLFANIATIGAPGIFIYGAFIFLFVYAFTELMDGSRGAIFWEVLKSTIAISLIFLMQDWFGVNKFSTVIPYILIVYFAISTFVTIWLAQKNSKSNKVQATV